MAKICSKCILNDSIPGITFNKEGTCNICQSYAKRSIPQSHQEKNGDLYGILKAHPKKYKYDCLCLYSGGKDSTYMLYNLVKKYKLRVLAFTMDNWFISKGALSNIQKVVSQLGVDNIIYKPSWPTTFSLFKTGIEKYKLSREAQSLAFLIGHACWPCFVMISVYSIKTAIKHNISNIVAGTTPGQLRQKDKNLLAKYNGIIDVYKTMVMPLLDIVDKHIKDELDLSFVEKIKSLTLRLTPFYEHYPYNEKDVIDTVQEKLGWKRPDDTDSCSSNCRINSLGVAIHRKLYNVNPYVIPLAHDVRSGLVERKEALRAVNADLDTNIVTDIAKKLELDAKNIIISDLTKNIKEKA